MRGFVHHRIGALAAPAPKRDEAGLTESTQWALVLPTLLAVVLGLVQTGVWLYGRTVAGQAAAAAAGAAALGEAFEPAALAIADRGGLTEVAVSSGRTGQMVTITVSGRVPTFFDVGQGQVSGRAVVPLEEVTDP